MSSCRTSYMYMSLAESWTRFGSEDQSHHQHTKVGQSFVIDAKRLQRKWTLHDYGQRLCGWHHGNDKTWCSGDKHGRDGTFKLCCTNVADHISKMKKGTYDSVCSWQHKTRPLFFVAWSDNAIVKTPLNYGHDVEAVGQHRQVGEAQDGGAMPSTNKRLLQHIPSYW